ncbi:DUF4054 domain-containing protein [Floridanema evergladense]|uniref:DUF4054 domain-containing protein n=1 Tax=Floridaenema evergladense BLCC-F167 TaxID=3153639 RepID=A0ABV4WCZ2_9CYAN
MITYSEFVIDFPEFADTTKYPQARVERAIARASTQVDNELGLASELIGQLTAHLLAIGTPGTIGGAGTGAISSLSVSGEYSVTYAGETQATGSNPLNATPYGREFLRLLGSISFTPVVV